MVKVECQVCTSYFSPIITPSSNSSSDDSTETSIPFLFFPCGHGMCKICITQDANFRSTCHTCRRPKGKHPIQLFVDFISDEDVPVPERWVETVTMEIGNIKEDAPEASVKHVIKEIRGVVQKESIEGGVNNEVLEQLLKAAKNLEKRILPVFHERDQLKNVNSLLKKQTVALKETLSAKDSTIKCLQNKVKILDQQVASESQLRSKRNIEHLAVVGRLAAETQDHRKLQKAYCEMESEVKQLKEKNDDFAKQIITLQRKNKEFTKYKLQHEEDQKSKEKAEKERDVTELKWVKKREAHKLLQKKYALLKVEIMKLAEEKVWFEEQVKCGLGGELSLDMKDGGCVEVHCVDASF